jgi:hypothetical protein
VAEQDISSYNFDGGSALTDAGDQIAGGSAGYPLNPMSGTTGGFDTVYTNIAINRDTLARVEATFREFNEKPELRFIKESLVVTQKAATLDYLDVASFFHPLQDFSDFQKQTFTIGPLNSVNIDSGSFEGTLGEASMVIARAYYLPESAVDERILFWDYKGNSRNIMGKFMVLTGAIKKDLHWKGWDLDPFSTYGHTGPADIGNGGLSFTNPTSRTVKLTIITAN